MEAGGESRGRAQDAEKRSSSRLGPSLELSGGRQRGISPFHVCFLLLENKDGNNVSLRGLCQEEGR